MRTRIVLLVCGVGMISGGILFGLMGYRSVNGIDSYDTIVRPLILQQVVGLPSSSLSTNRQSPLSPFSNSSDWGVVEAELDIKVESPLKMQYGDSSVIELIVAIKNIVYSRNSTGTKIWRGLVVPQVGRPPEFSQEQLVNIVQARIKSGDIGFLLSLAGVTVEPKGKNAISEMGIARWSIKPEGPGSFVGFIKPEFLKSAGGHSGEHRVEFSSEDNIPIRITATESIITLRSMISAVVTFLGTFLTLPGIIAFVEGRGKKHAEREEANK